MADTGKQSPLGINVIGSYLSNTGLTINPVAASYMGASKTNTAYTFGKCVQDTCLKPLTWAIHDGYNRGPGNGNATLTDSTYNNLIAIGSSSLGALGNSKPPTYIAEDPSGVWTTDSVVRAGREGIEAFPGPATSGYGNNDPISLPEYVDSLQGKGTVDQQQNATWIPYNTTNPNQSVTQWGYVRLHALQAWNEFNWNGDEVTMSTPAYQEFCNSFMSYAAFIDYTNQVIMSSHNAQTFMDGSYSNMDDLISADILGVNLASEQFGQDLINLGNLVNLRRIDAFGLPSVLLATLGENNAVVQDLVLALLASGLESSEIEKLVAGNIQSPTKEQEQKIYSAFLIIIGENLQEVLAPVQCKTQGLTSLVDLLNVKKLFPNSYRSMTVPKYNSQLGLPNNSKTYFPIYIDDSVNPALSTNEMKEYVGTQIPFGIPEPTDNIVSLNNITFPEKGFGSYLYGILPEDQAIAAGAFQFSLRQVRKIDQADFKNFANATKSMESMVRLPLTAGTSKPTNQAANNNTTTIEALGTGPYGTYTFSDVFGCMSGLPYPWKNLYNTILSSQTPLLRTIYNQLFLAVTWEAPTIQATYSSYQVETSPGVFTTYYTVTGATIIESGGGYGRGDAPNPIITFSNGGTGYATFGTDPDNLASLGGGTYGRLQSTVLTNPGPDTTSIPTATIEYPPTTAGTNSAYGTLGWQSPMNSEVQSYIDSANTEISSIAGNKPANAKLLTVYWNTLGTQLTIEQRTRYIAVPPVGIPKDPLGSPYPTSINAFIDSIPQLSQDTRPHMSAQTLEAISDLSSLGGQSTVGMMRQERNQARLQKAGFELDNNIPSDLSTNDVKTLTTNGTIPAGVGNPIPSPLIDLLKVENPEVVNEIEGYTNPSWVESVPAGIYIPTDSELVGTYIPVDSTKPGDITPILDGAPVPTVGTNVPAGLGTIEEPGIVIVQPPSQLDPARVEDNLNIDYISSTLLPARYNIQEAIDKVIECNCDCWIS